MVFSGSGCNRTAAYLAPLLRSCVTTASLLDDELILPSSPQLMLCSLESGVVQAHSPIVVLPQELSQLPHIALPSDSVLVLDSQNSSSVAFAAQSGLRLLDCGLSSRSTLTFSSLGKEDAMVALQRPVEDLEGHAVEPFELSLHLRQQHPPYPLLCCAATLILCGKWETLNGLII